MELLLKSTAIDAVPVLIARRIHYATFHLLSRCGVVIHQTLNQRLPLSSSLLADKARHKHLLGFHDIRLGNEPDPRLLTFLHVNLPNILGGAKIRFDRYKDLLSDYANNMITYEEFAAETPTALTRL